MGQKSRYLGYLLDMLGLGLIIGIIYAGVQMNQCGDALAQAAPPVITESAPEPTPGAVREEQAREAVEAAEQNLELARVERWQEAVVGAAQEETMPRDASDEAGMSGSIQEGDAWLPLEVEIARLAIHEGSGREGDTIAITQARMGWSVERLRREHPRALSPVGRGNRPWIAGLNAELTRPAQWDEQRMPWERGRAIWLRTLRTVRATMEGVNRCPGGTPQIWGGRTLDHTHIERRLSQGYRVVDCGSTANVYLRRDRARAH